MARTLVNGVYTVVRNDTFWWIAHDLYTQIYNASQASTDKTVPAPPVADNKIMSAVNWVARKNNISNINVLYVGQKLAIGTAADSSSSSTVVDNKNSNAPTITYFGRGIPVPNDISVDPATSGTDLSSTELLAIWKWSKETDTASYDFLWEYTKGIKDRNGDLIWLKETGSNSIDEEHKSDRGHLDAARQTTWDIPDGAITVRFRVRAIARKETVNNVEKSIYTNTDYCAYQQFQVNQISLPAPSAPSLEMTGQLQLTCRLTGIDARASKVEFEVWQNETKLFNSSKVTVSATHTATYKLNLAKSSTYQVRCRISNGTVWSNWSDFTDDDIKTVPDAPEITNIVVKPYQSGQQDTYAVQVDWTKRDTASEYAIEYIAKDQYLGIGQDGQFLPAGAAASNTYSVTPQVHPTSDTLPASSFSSSGDFYVHIRAKSSNDIYSDWSTIKSFTVGLTPNPPTTWSSTTSAIIGVDDLRLRWTHNSTDGSGERAAQLTYALGVKSNNDISWGNDVVVTIMNNRTGKKYYETSECQVILSNASASHTDQQNNSPAQIKPNRQNNQSVMRWSIKTAGATGTMSEPSVVRRIDIFSPPTLSITIDGMVDDWDYIDPVTQEATIDDHALLQFPFYISASNQSTDQTALSYYINIMSNEQYDTINEFGQTNTIRRGDSVFESVYDELSLNQIPFSADNIDLHNNVEYTIFVEMTTNAGLTDSREYTFIVRWQEGTYYPNAEIGIDYDSVSAIIQPYCENEQTERVTNVLLSVYRREYDGTFKEVIADIDAADAAFVVDPHPALDFARYRIVSKEKATGKIDFYDPIGYPVGVSSIIIQWDESWQSFNVDDGLMSVDQPYAGSMVRLPYNVDVSESNDRDVSLVDYIGRESPVSYYGTKVGTSGSWSADIPKSDKDTIYALRRLSRWMGDVYVREPSGVGYWAKIDVSFNQNHTEVVVPVQITVTKVEGGL